MDDPPMQGLEMQPLDFQGGRLDVDQSGWQWENPGPPAGGGKMGAGGSLHPALGPQGSRSTGP